MRKFQNVPRQLRLVLPRPTMQRHPSNSPKGYRTTLETCGTARHRVRCLTMFVARVVVARVVEIKVVEIQVLEIQVVVVEVQMQVVQIQAVLTKVVEIQVLEMQVVAVL